MKKILLVITLALIMSACNSQEKVNIDSTVIDRILDFPEDYIIFEMDAVWYLDSNDNTVHYGDWDAFDFDYDDPRVDNDGLLILHTNKTTFNLLKKDIVTYNNITDYDTKEYIRLAYGISEDSNGLYWLTYLGY